MLLLAEGEQVPNPTPMPRLGTGLNRLDRDRCGIAERCLMTRSMTRPNPPRSFANLPLALAVSIALSACGGGGGTDASSQQAAPVDPLATTPVASTVPAPDVATSTSTAPDGAASPAERTDTTDLATAMAASATESPVAPIATDTLDRLRSAPPAAAYQAVDATATADEGAPTVNIQAVGAVTASTGTVYYVDSAAGNDSNTGLAATAGANGVGPWRTLSKVAQASLRPGDVVRLTCGSVWNETLRLSASGTSASPITVTSYPAGCSNQPTIDGAVAIAAGAWAPHKGNIYKTSLATTPLQLHAATGVMTQAHHPNRGHDSSQPDSPYLKVAADADRASANGRVVSTSLTTGNDLVLPSGVTLNPGIGARVRSASWILDESRVSAVDGKKLTLATPTSYALTAGWGYYLLGALWMLDSAGEWHHDTTSNTLYAWMPDSRPPTVPVWATTLSTGIDLQARQYVTVDGVTVRRVGTGVMARGSRSAELRNSSIQDTAGIGIDAAASVGFIASSNTLARTGQDAVSGVDYTAGTASGMQIVGNSVTDSGVLISGGRVLSLPVRSYAAIRGGLSAVISGNTITNTNYNGIWAWPNNTISGNVVSGACMVLDDCGSIYANGVNNASIIRGNVVLSARGAMAGKGPPFTTTQAQGIYLDESASGLTVQGNTAFDNDYGVKLHVASRNLLTGNKLYGNRFGQLWLQENRNTDNPAGDLFGNIVSANQIVSTSGSAKAIWLDTIYADTAKFGSFDGNRFYDRIFANVVDERTASGSVSFNLAQWKLATGPSGAARNNEASGWGASMTLFAASKVSGASIVPNGNVVSSLTGWTAWNEKLPIGSLLREPCMPGNCVRYIPGGSSGIVSSPRFSITAGTWYRLTVDLAAANPGQVIDLVVRRGGGGSNGYESLSDRSLKLKADTGWTRHTITFKATKTINANDPVTRDAGARVDFQNLAPGQPLIISNLELVPVTPADAMNRSDLLLNTDSAAKLINCPLAATQPAMCLNYLRLADNQPVTWPLAVPAHSSEIVYTRDLSLVDSDGDGIPDAQDSCPTSARGLVANSRGCTLAE